MAENKVIVITGPTASGKTALALDIAKKIQNLTGKIVEIISADSRQVYKHIPVTTAQPAKEQLICFKHHFVNSIELDEEFSAGEFGRKARILIDDLFNSGKIPLVVGGSGLYISSLVYGFFEISSEDKDLIVKFKEKRKELYKLKEENGIDFLVNELKKYDPELLDELKEIKQRRVIRALEVFFVTGIPISIHQKMKIKINFIPQIYGLQIERSNLYDRINKRTLMMIENGMIDEILAVKNKGFHYKTHNSLNTVGAKEVFDYLEGIISKNRMTELIQQNTRRFAKRQMTWFRRDKNIRWIADINDIDFSVVP